ncbi:hypothetical protein HY745_08600 [Candidatus Desantisbacteria bacterium]|nr:hypothetical protein [Candidatus Desantisbacteria bacterium]
MKKNYLKIFYIVLILLLVSGLACDKKTQDQIDHIEIRLGLKHHKKTSQKTEAEILQNRLNSIANFRKSIALQIDNSAIALKSLQFAKPGDIFILNNNNNDKSIQNYIGNISLYDSFEQKIEERNMGQLGVDFSWEKSYRTKYNVGITFADYAIEALFNEDEVNRVNIKLSIIDATIKRLNQPADSIQEFESNFDDNEIKGNIVVTCTLEARIKIEYNAYDKKDREIKIDGNILKNTINNLSGIGAGYAESASSSNSINIVQQSALSKDTFAITFLPIDKGKQDEVYINEILSLCENAPEDVNETSQIIYWQDEENYPLVEFKIRQKRIGKEPSDDVTWYLSVKNIDVFKDTFASITFKFVCYNNSNTEIIIQNYSISDLKYGKEKDMGIISQNTTPMQSTKSYINGYYSKYVNGEKINVFKNSSD